MKALKRTFPNIAKLVKVSRSKLNPAISQNELSEKIGYKNGQFISNIERGQCSVPIGKVIDLADALHIPMADVSKAIVKDFKDYHINSMVQLMDKHPNNPRRNSYE